MEPKKDKVPRSLKLESDINDRLVAVCRHLGVNPNAYLINEIGKAISRDEVAFVVAKNQKDSIKEMMDMLKNLSDEQDIPKL
jgi:predicted DNA-binding protein